MTATPNNEATHPMTPNNPMTEGEALAVLDVDAIASSLVDWMLTKAMPNGDLLHASVACDYAGMANFKRAVSKQLRAALTAHTAASGGEVKWPKRMVNLPCPEGTGDRIIGFRVPDGDPILGDYGLSEPLAWFRKVTIDRVAPPPAAVPADALERLVEKWRETADGWYGDDFNRGRQAVGMKCADELAALIPKGADHEQR